MADPSIAVSLSPSVEQLILQICDKQSLPPPDTVARRRLALIGEKASLRLLRSISPWKIHNLSQSIMQMTENIAASSPSPSPDSSPQKKPRLSSPHKQQKQQQQQGSPSSSSKNRTRRAITQGLGLPSSVSDNPIGQAFSPQLGVPSLSSENPIGQSFSPQLGAPSSSSEHPLRQAVSPQLGSSSSASEIPSRQAITPNLSLPSSSSDIPNRQEFSPQLGVPSLSSENPTAQSFSPQLGAPSLNLEHPLRQAVSPQLGAPSSSSEHPLRQAVSPQLGSSSSASEIPSRQAITPNLSLPSSSSDIPNRQEFSPHSIALGELEFRKAFLILSYTAGNRLEDIISADKIRPWKQLTMVDFELQVWKAFGCKFIKQEDRRKFVDWDSGKTFQYHCFVSQDGRYTFKGPFLKTEKTHLQRVLGDDNVLNVKFAEWATNRNSSGVNSHVNKSIINKIFRDGILVGLRRYRFLVFKDGGKEGKKEDSTASPVKCLFVCMESHASTNSSNSYILSNKTVHEARCLFMHAHTVATVAKYMARFSLILSKTIKLEVDLASLHIEMIDDIPCRDEYGSVVLNEDGEPRIHTDGTGFISEDLAVRCPKNIYKGKHKNTPNERFLCNAGVEEKVSELQQPGSHFLEPPLLIQCRMFNNGCAVKGTLLVNRKEDNVQHFLRLPPRTIQYRPSMLKVTPDSKLSDTPTVNSLEIVGTSNQPRKTYLSRYLIALLRYGGLPEQFFMDIVMNALEEAQSIHYNKRAAFRASLNHGEMDNFTAALMISSGIPLDEPYLQYRLSIIMKEERKSLKGGKLPISDSFYLMGTADPTDILKSDEVCIILDNGQISGKVLVYKHPGLHFGDIHVLNATYVKEMEDFVGNAKYAIFFPTKGRRSLADEMAGSDFDGDIYFVSRNFQLLNSFKPSDPWTPSKKHVLEKKPIDPCRHTDSKEPVRDRKPNEFSAEELEHKLFQLFIKIRFEPSRAVGVSADSWLAFMDRLLILGDDSAEEKEEVRKKMLQLIDIHYDALDAPKSGMKIQVPDTLKPKKYPHYMERGGNTTYYSSSILGKIFDRVESYQMEGQIIQDILPLSCFDEIEVPESCLNIWEKHYKSYSREMTEALQHPGKIKNESADAVIEKYKQILYAAPEFEQTQRNIEEIYNEALAIYKITYAKARSKANAGSCQFAWKVAGKALCMIYSKKQGDKSIPCSLSFLRDIFC